MKRIITLLMMVIFSMCGISVSAAEPSNRALQDIKALKIMQGDDNGDMMLNKKLTRAEFATVILNIIGEASVADGYTKSVAFTDVKSDAWYASIVGYISDRQIMVGYSDKEFAPEDSVTLEQAVKTLVVILGYQDVALSRGGYPDGYMSVGVSLGLLNDVAPDENGFVRGDLVTLLYNALDINRLVIAGFGTEKGSTLRYELTNGGERIFDGKGVINANYEYYLSEAVSDIKFDEVRIGDIIYKAGNTNAAEYIGMEVRYYAEETEDGEYVLNVAEPTKNNSKLILDSDDIDSVENGVVKYSEDGKNKTLRMEDDCVIVKNMSIITVKNDDVFNVENGILKFIDNTGNNKADVVIIEDYQCMIAEQARGNIIYFKDNTAYNGKRYLKADPDGDEKYIITDKDGKYIDISEIPSDSVMSIAESSDKSSYRIIVNDEKIEGNLKSKSDKTITIDDRKLNCYTDLNEISVGDTIEAYLDFKGNVVYAEITEKKSSAYGYISKTWIDEREKAYIRVIKGGTVTESVEVNNQNEEDDEVPIIICQNEGLATYELSSKVKLDGTRIGNDISDLVGKVVEIYTDSNNVVKKLNTMEICGGGINVGMVFNVKNRTFSGGGKTGAFAIDGKTKVICVPSSSSPSKDDYMVQVQLDNKDSTRKYVAQGYKYNDKTKRVELMVITEDMNASSVTNVNIDTCKIGFVTSSYQYVDDDDEIRVGLEITTKTGTKEYETVKIIDANKALNDIDKGDLIFFEESNTGKIENAVIMQNIRYGMASFYDKRPNVDELRQKGYYAICGDVTDISFDEINEGTGMMTDAVTLNVDGAEYDVYINQVNSPSVFLCEGKYFVTYTNADEIYPGEDKMYAIITADGTVKAAVILR